ncbi:MAG TPA: membrane protein insertase YidC [Nocardioides sp.]|nr:membrane protein insertase YidC [Nocardioides sp.]
MHALGTIGHFILTPLYYAISAVLLGFHELFSLVLPSTGGASWVLSIVGLTLVIRAALIPLFVKQINASRNMQLIQPKVRELQKKYGHDREKLAQETMALYKESGTNPFASCLPLLVQSPVFIALFRLLDQAAKYQHSNGFLTHSEAVSFGHARLFGHLPIAATFLKPFNPGTTDPRLTGVMILAAILVVAMTATTFTTQRQLMSKNMPADAMSGQYAQQQKMLLYVLPVVFAVGGIAFPIGVLFYWTTTNLWTMGQQFYVIRRNPAPGTPAFDAKLKRDRAKGVAVDEPLTADGPAATEAIEPPKQPRQQPKRQSKKQRKRTGGAKPGGAQRDDDDGTTEGKTA